MKTTTTITVANIKGGVGKTTTAWMLARHLALRARVLLIDMDPRASLTSLSGVVANGRHIGHVLGGANQPSATLRTAAQVGAHDIAVVPACMDVANVAHGLHNRMFDRFNALADAIRNTGSDWDVIVVDSPANADVLTINALAVAQILVLPTQPEEHSIGGMIETERLFGQVYRAMGRTDVWQRRTVMTLSDSRTLQHQAGCARIETLSAWPRLYRIPRRNGADADSALMAAYAPLAEEIVL